MTVQRIKEHDLMTWESCDMKDIQKGDVFYTIDNGLTGPVLIAVDNAKQVPNPKNKTNLVWSVKSKPF
ncbi:TPA: hypothetical protein KD091_004768 [Vibrio parahaemolyticus]|nr:hypothetical protein [Vibrio parahaemolyticus]